MTDPAERPALPAQMPMIRAIAMPSDTNPAGDIFGGLLMAQMDPAAGNAAARRAREHEEVMRVTQAVFTFVAIDADGRPRPVPQEMP